MQENQELKACLNLYELKPSWLCETLSQKQIERKMYLTISEYCLGFSLGEIALCVCGLLTLLHKHETN